MELELLRLLQGNYSTLFFPLQWIQLVILHIHPAMTEGGRTHETLQWTCGLLPEEDVPEKQPAWINQQCYEWVD